MKSWQIYGLVSSFISPPSMRLVINIIKNILLKNQDTQKNEQSQYSSMNILLFPAPVSGYRSDQLSKVSLMVHSSNCMSQANNYTIKASIIAEEDVFILFLYTYWICKMCILLHMTFLVTIVSSENMLQSFTGTWD